MAEDAWTARTGRRPTRTTSFRRRACGRPRLISRIARRPLEPVEMPPPPPSNGEGGGRVPRVVASRGVSLRVRRDVLVLFFRSSGTSTTTTAIEGGAGRTARRRISVLSGVPSNRRPFPIVTDFGFSTSAVPCPKDRHGTPRLMEAAPYLSGRLRLAPHYFVPRYSARVCSIGSTRRRRAFRQQSRCRALVHPGPFCRAADEGLRPGPSREVS